MHNINTYLFELIYRGVGYWPILDWFFIVLTSYITYIVIGLTALWIVGYTPFRTDDMRERLRRFAHSGEVVLSLFLTWTVVWVTKILVAYPRPFVSIPGVIPLVHAAPLESFPSSHAALAMAIATAVYPRHKTLGELLFAFAFVIGLSRIYVGVHYPLDVGVGFAIGFLIPKIIHRIFAKPKRISAS